MNYTVVGMFNDQEHVADAAEKLRANGFDNDNVDVSPFRFEGDSMGVGYDHVEKEESKGFWASLFGDDDDENRNRHRRMASRNHVVTVYAADRTQADRAAQIMDGCGAIDVTDEDDKFTSSQEYGLGGMAVQTGDNKESISVVKENLEVGKREVESGNVRIRSRVVEKPVQENVRLRKERVYVTRTPVDRTLSDNESATFQDETIEMSAHSEKAVVNKTAHVVEEISLNKDVNTEDKVITDTVRETEIEIEGENDHLTDDDLNLRNDPNNRI